MSHTKVSRKELAAQLVNKIQETLNGMDARAAKKTKKSAESAARKIAKEFGINLKKIEKKAASAPVGEKNEAKKAKKKAKDLLVKAAKEAKLTAEAKKVLKPKKKDLSLATDGQT